jgi:carbonic anhydrase
MLESYQKLIEGNKKWVDQMNSEYPDFFNTLAKGQNPTFFWIGCSDSRISANQITGTLPGEIFVHRNVANLVVHTDFNLLTVLQYAVEVLNVKHVIVCGHYGCGGIQAALSNREYGLIDNWLCNIKDIYRFHSEELKKIEDPEMLSRRLVELNVREQVLNLAKTTIIQNAWKNDNRPHLHGFVYELQDGLLNDLGIYIKDNKDLESIYQFSL